MNKKKMKEIRKQVRSAMQSSVQEMRNDLDYANSQANEEQLEKEEKFVPHAISNATFGHYRQQQKEIDEAMKTLRNAGYYVDSMYHIDDVKSHYDCEDEIAQEIIGLAIDSDGTANQIWEAITYMAEDEYGLKLKE